MLTKIAKILVIIGALNWGSVGISLFYMKDLNLMHIYIGGSEIGNLIEAFLYLLIAISGIYLVFLNFKTKKNNLI